jgi:ketopantoate reductase
MNSSKRVLIVGAGAVGQVYGWHLARAGAQVSFFVRDKYVEECRRGFTVYRLNDDRHKRRPLRFLAAEIFSSLSEVATREWDQVFLTVSSPALRGGWVDQLSSATGSATIVSLQSGIEDREFLLRSISDVRLVHGMISLVSYATPLPGETVSTPGMAFWLPPLSSSPFSGPRAAEVVSALKAGGMPAKLHYNVPQVVAFGGACLMILVAALEAEGWSFRAMRTGGSLNLACKAISEAFTAISYKFDLRPPPYAVLIHPSLIRALLWLLPHFVRFDLETYFRVHFTKVGAQTRQELGAYTALSKRYHVAADSLQRLETLIR